MVAINGLIPVLSLCLGASATFSIYNATTLENKNMGAACVKALSEDIDCPSHIRSFMAPSYHGSLRNATLTDEVCTENCSASLRTWFDTVVDSCADEDFGAGVPQRFGGYIWAGWNETCIRDPKTKEYCNDVIADFTPSKRGGKEQPREQLCSYCNHRKLATMQSSSYSVYNRYYQSRLEEVYKKCNVSGPTEIPPPFRVEKTVEFCLSEKYYTTKEGDTCDSIARAHPGVAGVFLYMGNQEIIQDCRDIPAGRKLCLPSTCPIYVVKPGDTCWSIERSLGLPVDEVEYYNSWINVDCTNLQKATDFYGKPLCIGPFAGSSNSMSLMSNTKTYNPGLRIKFSSANGPVPKPAAKKKKTKTSSQS